MTVMLDVQNVCKSFTLHNQGGVCIPVCSNLSFTVEAGECVALHGQSGAGKSTLLRSLYANYKPTSGSIYVRHHGEMVDLVAATPRTVLDIRKHTIGYVSQFLRVIPRVSALNIVAEAGRERSAAKQQETDEHAVGEHATGEQVACRARALLTRLHIPERLWELAPATFSGGEQQRVNIARGFIVDYPVLLLDEPTASLDAVNRQVVVELIQEAKARGTAVVGIFHDDEVRKAVADRTFMMKTLEHAA